MTKFGDRRWLRRRNAALADTPTWRLRQELNQRGDLPGGPIPGPPIGPDEADITIDTLRYVVKAGTYTGEQIRRFAHPPINADRLLYIENRAAPDLAVGDADEAVVITGVEFYTVARYVNGG